MLIKLSIEFGLADLLMAVSSLCNHSPEQIDERNDK